MATMTRMDTANIINTLSLGKDLIRMHARTHTVQWYPNRYVVLFYHVVFYLFLHILCTTHHNRLHLHNAIVFLYVCILFPPFFRLWWPTNSVDEAATTTTTWMTTTTTTTTQASPPPPPNSITLPCKSLLPPSLLPLTSHTHHYHIWRRYRQCHRITNADDNRSQWEHWPTFLCPR